MKRPFVSAPQDGPGHKAVTLVAGRDRLRIECQSNEQAKELSLALIGLFKRVFPKPEDKAQTKVPEAFLREGATVRPHYFTPGLPADAYEDHTP